MPPYYGNHSDLRNENKNKRPAYNYDRNPRMDDKKNAKKAERLLIGAAAILLLTGGGAKAVSTLNYNKYDANGKTLSEVCDEFDIDERAILLANSGIEEDEPLDTIKMPEKYDGLEEKISDIEERLESTKLDYAERNMLKSQLNSIKARQDCQHELAQTYLSPNGKYVYIIPNDYGIALEEIKEAFGIKDGVIRDYNNIEDYTWGITPEIGTGYRDYTRSLTPYEGIKVPVDKLNKP